MRVVAVISPKGGVGKTTVTASLASELIKSGERVVVVDLDPQNALRLHLGMPHAECGGISRVVSQNGWSAEIHQSTFGAEFLPYGTIDESQREIFEQTVRQDADWLRRGLDSLGLPEMSVVLIDTPPGPGIYLQQALSVAHLALVVLKPDAASYSTVPQVESLIQYYTANRPEYLGHCFVINQMDASKQLSRDIFSILRSRLGERFVPVGIHRDESVTEALAYQQPVTQYARHSSAAYDISQLAGWLQKTYGLTD